MCFFTTKRGKDKGIFWVVAGGEGVRVGKEQGGKWARVSDS